MSDYVESMLDQWFSQLEREKRERFYASLPEYDARYHRRTEEVRRMFCEAVQLMFVEEDVHKAAQHAKFVADHAVTLAASVHLYRQAYEQFCRTDVDPIVVPRAGDDG